MTEKAAMPRLGAVLAAALVAVALAGCVDNAADVDTPRAIDSDINASLNKGPTSTQPGVVQREEPKGALPGQPASQPVQQ